MIIQPYCRNMGPQYVASSYVYVYIRADTVQPMGALGFGHLGACCAPTARPATAGSCGRNRCGIRPAMLLHVVILKVYWRAVGWSWKESTLNHDKNPT